MRAAPDGYTLLLVNPANAINAALYPNLNFNFIRETLPVASVCVGSMVANPSLPARTVPEFIAFAKTNTGKINRACAGAGTPPHVFGELFKMMTGVDLVHVSYRSNYMPDLLSGQVQLAFSSIPASIEFICCALAATPARRLHTLPDIPALAEFVPGYDANNWYGISAPRNTPTEIADKLNKQTKAVVADPEFDMRLAAPGNVPVSMTPAELGKFSAEETEKWAKVAKFADIKPE
jgi:tripartite-type tricarboxylate transporter receptor subunit TctC